MATVLIAALVGCQAPRTSETRATAGSERTPAEAVAADLCVEHGVLEAICTKCHPKLIPVFQAKGDWCQEHGFPLSVCPVHHPERGGRPAVDVSVDEAPADGTQIRFKSLESARAAGLELVEATHGPDATGVEATATLVADASGSAVVNARAAGVIHRILADLGTRVTAGTPLVEIQSGEVGDARSRLQSARARVEEAESSFRREQELHERGISAAKEVEAARRDRETAQAELAAARAALSMMGAAEGASGVYLSRAPIGGVVTARHVTVGTLVRPDQPLFEIVDTSMLWADLDVPEAHAPRVAPGQRVALRVDGLPDRDFHGTLSYVAPVVESRTRTVKARARIDTPDPSLRANMYARATILADASQTAVLLPRPAVQEIGGVQLAFVQLAEDRYEVRRIKAEAAGGDQVVVHRGLRPGERVVATGSFLLKTETLKESIGTGCCEVEPPRK